MADISIDIHDDAWMKRDLYGYGPDRPDAKWPGGAKIAVNCELCQTPSRALADGQSYSTTKREVSEVSRMETNTPRPFYTSMELSYVEHD